MSFELALKQGRLEEARAILDNPEHSPDPGGRWLRECHAK
jgi:hypothetical protein